MGEPSKANDDSDMTDMQAPVPETAQVSDEAMIDYNDHVQHEIGTPPSHVEEHVQHESNSLLGPESDPIQPDDPDSLFIPEIEPTPLRNSSPSVVSESDPTAASASQSLFIPETDSAPSSNSDPFPTPESDATPSDIRAAEIFEEKMRYYDNVKKANNGSLPFRLEIEQLKLQLAETARRKKRARDIAKAIEDDSIDPAVPRMFDIEQDVEEDELSDTDFVQPRTRKEVCMQDTELQSMMTAIDAMNDNPKRKRKRKTVGGRADVTLGKITKSGKRSNKKQKLIDDGAQKATSLLYSNVFTEQAAPDAPEQPFFTSRTKIQALKELVASVPIEDEKQARSDATILMKATRQFSRNAVKPDAKSGLWSVKGMKTTLKAYQVLGTGFMRQRENATEEPRGGILADQMGLGKTLMTLANIHDGRPPKGSGRPRTTLIVASPALLTQWKSEIEKHSSTELKIMRYGAGTRDSFNASSEILKGHDIVLTTYNEVMLSHPKTEPPESCETEDQEKAWWQETWEQRGALHRVHFLRIVLDEAHAIKNHMSRTSIACRALQADHKWTLSGTPILNSLTELYPYFKFLGVPLTGSFEDFKDDYCKPNSQERLLVRLSQFMIRRTHANTIMGAPIVKLPQAHQATYWCKFNPVERCIYEIVHSRFIKRTQTIIKNKGLKKSYYNIYVMFLRLRQLTAHILMLQFVIRDLLELEDIEHIKQVLHQHTVDSNTQSRSTIIAVRKQLQKIADEEKKKKCDDLKANKEGKGQDQNSVTDEEEEDEEEDEEEEPKLYDRFEAGGNFGKDYNFGPFLSSLQTGKSWERAKKTAKCSACGKKPQQPMLTSCGHLICAEPCYSEACVEAAEQGEENPVCKTCGVIPTSIIACDMETDPQDIPASGTRSNGKKKKNKGRKRIDREDIAHDWLASLDDDVLPSAKTIAVKSQIMNWIKENPKVKIIVYTQFLAMIQILRRVCQKEGWNAIQYHGKMSLTARNNAIQSFGRKEDDVRIMLASMQCGGLGLNLTMASKVIFIDPWWNSGAEQQAFCRVFRIGQKEKTFMSRLCVQNTIDNRIIEIQERKEKELERVMKEGGRPVQGINIRKLIEMFVGEIGEGVDDDVSTMADDEMEDLQLL
ncbi:hypothetical protein COCVIDRAFT_34661 [Bipolaris victoriae FI3]|uniref:Uncharacterized protein n=1 Tax=Bipolaris victoriae (strain FI3) TaxID=930091 RepID=W7EIQ5_BIPV3|nr:hypothetical protein COCVIDRAFT_34661 [Bipolaris victoriae FI3]